MNKSIVIVTGDAKYNETYGYVQPRAELISSTCISMVIPSPPSSSSTLMSAQVTWQVIEFY